MLPQLCPGCESRISRAFCESCYRAIDRAGRSRCRLCGSEVLAPDARTLCPQCLSPSWPLDALRVRALYWSRAHDPGPLERAIWRLKYAGDLSVLPALRALLLSCPLEGLGEIDCVIPVPLHVSRLRQRGFNQALLLARPLGRKLGALLDPLGVERVRATAPQVGLGPSERRRNVRDAFRARPGRVRDRCVLLVDDVVTSGATLLACARALRDAGARGVSALCLARAVPA
ncbi:MAG: amidophosphoribosyltransferase [Candidatus Binatia bacterium]|nr:MAG: amidophosphoribosyltransferase [Candidatus Binatia bacterium]